MASRRGRERDRTAGRERERMAGREGGRENGWQEFLAYVAEHPLLASTFGPVTAVPSVAKTRRFAPSESPRPPARYPPRPAARAH